MYMHIFTHPLSAAAPGVRTYRKQAQASEPQYRYLQFWKVFLMLLSFYETIILLPAFTVERNLKRFSVLFKKIKKPKSMQHSFSRESLQRQCTTQKARGAPSSAFTENYTQPLSNNPPEL